MGPIHLGGYLQTTVSVPVQGAERETKTGLIKGVMTKVVGMVFLNLVVQGIIGGEID